MRKLLLALLVAASLVPCASNAAIGVLGTPANQNDNTSYTAVAGSNRVVVTTAWSRRTGATSLNNVVWNSITRSPETTGNDAAGNDRSGTGIAIFKESEIGGASNMNLVWVTDSPASAGQMPITVGDVDQTTTVRSSASANDVTTGNPTTAVITISATAGDQILCVYVNRNGATYTVNNGFTSLGTGTNGDGGRYLYLSKIAAGSNDNCSVTQNVSDAWQGSAVVLVPFSGGGGGTIINPLAGGGGAAARPVTFNWMPAANDDEFLLRANQ